MIKVYPSAPVTPPPPTLEEIKAAIEASRVSVETKVAAEVAKVAPAK